METNEMLEKLEKEGFFHHNHYQIEKIEDESVTLKAELTEESMNPYGIAHGGFLFGLGDTAMGMIIAKNKKLGVTLNSNIHFLRPGKGKYIKARGEIIKEGKTICVAKASIYDEEENLLAIMDADYYVKEERR